MLNLCHTAEADSPHVVYYESENAGPILIKSCRDFKSADKYSRRKSILISRDYIFITSKYVWDVLISKRSLK